MALILIVDDSNTMRQMVNFTLTDAGHEVVEARDAAEAMEQLQLNKFELIISDVNMPGMSGIDLVREVRNMSDYKFTPILVLTTESQQDIKQKGRAAGATGWIVKPFNPEVLLSVLGKVLA
jgi:two-component system, chemotaxis family, chemotaxis protein CheY